MEDMVAGVNTDRARSHAEVELKDELVHATGLRQHIMGSHVLVHHQKREDATPTVAQVNCVIACFLLCFWIVLTN